MAPNSLVVVIREGFEPTTRSLEGCCSIQLSYRTKISLIFRFIVFCLCARSHTQWLDHNHLSYSRPELLPRRQHHSQLNVKHRSLIPHRKTVSTPERICQTSLYSHRESNPDLKFRKLPFYPLNYGSICLFSNCLNNIFKFFNLQLYLFNLFPTSLDLLVDYI